MYFFERPMESKGFFFIVSKDASFIRKKYFNKKVEWHYPCPEVASVDCSRVVWWRGLVVTPDDGRLLLISGMSLEPFYLFLNFINQMKGTSLYAHYKLSFFGEF